jgi:hypothetical protein
MLKKILKWLTNYLADLSNKIVAGIILFSFSAGAWVVWSKNLLQTLIPLWIVILIVLAILFGCSILFLIYSCVSSALPYKIKYFTIGGQKWKVKIFNGSYFEIDENPICKVHDLPFISGSTAIFCPESQTGARCKSLIVHTDRHREFKKVQSYIDKKVRNKDYS